MKTGHTRVMMQMIVNFLVLYGLNVFCLTAVELATKHRRSNDTLNIKHESLHVKVLIKTHSNDFSIVELHVIDQDIGCHSC